MPILLRSLVLPLSGVVVVAASAFACGGSTSSDATNDAGNDADVATNDAAPDATPRDSGCPACPLVDSGPPPPPPQGVPPDPGGPPPDGAGSTVLATSHMYIGDTDRNGAASASAWKQYGLNLDGKITDKSSTDVCTLASGASKSTQVDGANGIDNSWGENILPIILTVGGADAGKKLNDAIASGAFATLLRLDKLGAAQNYSPLPGSVYRGAQTASPPKWDGTDLWPIDTASVNAGDVNQPKVLFSAGYMNARVWVGEPPQNLELPFSFGGVDWAIPLRNARILMQVAPDGRSATFGTIAGTLETEQYIMSLKQVAGRISTSLCSGSAFDSIAQQIRQASDMMANGTNAAGAACNAISFGWGFDAKAVKLGPVVPSPAPSPDPCGADAGQ